MARTVSKKRKKVVKKGGLSFSGDDEDEEECVTSLSATPRGSTPVRDASEAPPTDVDESSEAPRITKKRLKPNAAIAHAPKALTKSALLKESRLREQLRKEYVQLQEAVKATEFILPFVFYDGKSSPGGKCRMKKGDPIWLFLEQARKVGADMAGRTGDRTKKDWARISVDDLMVVKGDLIIPHHYDFHTLILNQSVGYNKALLFPYSSSPTAATPAHLIPPPTKVSDSEPTIPETPSDNSNLSSALSTAASRAQAKAQQIPDSALEGYNDDPELTRVVDRRWYERNKHIYPASTWEEFELNRDYSSSVKKDRQGNAFFFGR